MSFSPQRACGGLLLLLLASCSEPPLPVHRQEFPGFSIELPAGKVLADTRLPSVGKYTLDVPVRRLYGAGISDRRELQVNWSTLVYPPEVLRDQLLPALAPALPGAGVDGKLLDAREVARDRWVYILGSETSTIALAFVTCDPRFSVTLSYVRYLDRERQGMAIEQLARSIECRVTDANRNLPIVATRLPAKLGRVESTTGQLFRSIDGEYLGVSVASATPLTDVNAVRQTADAVVRGFLAVSVSDWKVIQQAQPDKLALILAGTRTDNQQRIYFGFVGCSASSLNVGMAFMAPHADDALARERFGQVDCPGRLSTPSPEFRDLLKSAEIG